MLKGMSDLALPEKAIDGYELRWWLVGVTGMEEHRAVYHVNTPWAQAEGNDLYVYGVAFVDEWQIFRDGRFVGRSSSGWEAVLTCMPDEPIVSASDAGYEYRQLLRKRIRGLTEELAETQKKLKEAPA